MQKTGIHKKIEIPFIQEIFQFENLMGDNMYGELVKIFDTYEPGEIVSQEKVLSMVEQVQSLKKVFTFPGKDMIYRTAKEKIISLFGGSPKVLDYSPRKGQA